MSLEGNADVAVVPDIVDAIVGTSQLTNALATTVDLTAIESSSGESIPVAPTTSHLSEPKIVLPNSAENSAVSQCGKVAIPKLSPTRTTPYPKAKPGKVKPNECTFHFCKRTLCKIQRKSVKVLRKTVDTDF